MKALEEAFQQEMAQQEQNLNNAVSMLMAAPQQQAEVENMANQIAPAVPPEVATV